MPLRSAFKEAVAGDHAGQVIGLLCPIELASVVSGHGLLEGPQEFASFMVPFIGFAPAFRAQIVSTLQSVKWLMGIRQPNPAGGAEGHVGQVPHGLRAMACALGACQAPARLLVGRLGPAGQGQRLGYRQGASRGLPGEPGRGRAGPDLVCRVPEAFA